MKNKVEQLRDILSNDIDILMINETKIDYTSITTQFHIRRFSACFRRDRTLREEGILLYVREDIP